MKIGLNGQRLLWKNPAGPEKYTYHLYNALAKVDRINRYTIYFDKKFPSEYFEKLTNNNPNFNFKIIKNKISWTQAGLSWELIKHPVDIFFSPVHTIPVIKLPKMKVVSMIHGLEYKSNKQFGTKPIHKLLYPFILFWICTFSKKIIVPSIATKNEVINKPLLKHSKHKINVVPEGVDETFHKKSDAEIENVKSKYEIKGNYLIFLSTIQPRKNIPKMVEAFSKIDADITLVIAGKKGWNYNESLGAPKKYGVENKVMFLGRIDNSDRAPLLSGAKAYVSCSLEEGFGLPLLEALACKTQSVVSNIPAYREVGGKFPIFVNPKNATSIKNGIETILNNPKKLVGIEDWVTQFTWEKTAKKIRNTFQHI